MFRRLREYKAAAKAAALAGDAPEPVGGELSSSVIRTVVQRRRDQYMRWYQEGLSRDPKLAGKVNIRLGIDEKGALAGLTDGGSTLPDPRVIQCILDEFAQLRFPARDAGGTQTVVYPLVFSAGD